MADVQVQYREETINELREAFKRKDKEGTGTLEPEELAECLELMGLIATDEDIDFLTKHFDKNGDGVLQIEELVENVGIINSHIQYREDLMEAFALFDTAGDGYIRGEFCNRLPKLLKILTFNNFMKPEDARKLLSHLIKNYDRDSDGKFNYAEFVEIFVAKELDPEKIEENRRNAIRRGSEARQRKKKAKRDHE